MKRASLLILGFLFITSLLMAQKITVSGIVTSKEDGLPVIGASVVEKGTTNGTITNIDGNFNLVVNEGSLLVFTYVGMQTIERKAVSGEMYKVVLSSSSIAIEEVVVTAMGVKSEKKKLNFAVQNVNSEALTDGRSANFVNALQGKVAGVSVTNSGGSPNSGSQIILRGISSINASQNNEPLFILDGMPLSGRGSNAADINPNDIESVTVLKGAAASALYGQDAASGVIMITTKQGKTGKLSVSANASWQIDNAVRLPEIQSMYGPGTYGFYKPEASGGSGGWGPLLSSNETVYDNIGNYFKTGYYRKYDIGVDGGSEKFKARASVNYSKNDGIIVNDYLQKYGGLVNVDYSLSKKLNVTFLANVINSEYRGGSGVSSVYLWPINDDITNYDAGNGYPRFRYIDESSKKDSPISPLWSRYKDYGKNTSSRNILQTSIVYKPLTNLSLTGRFSLDQKFYSYDGYTVPRYNDNSLIVRPTSGTDEEKAAFDAYYATVPYITSDDVATFAANDLLGVYSNSSSNSKLYTANVMANYSLKLSKDMTVEMLVGGELKNAISLSNSITGRNFVIPGTYSIGNVSSINGTDDVTATHSEIRRAGTFGEVRGDYKGIVNVSVTSRFDWSSTLDWEESPYFYPSITGGVIYSELFNLKNDWFSYGKIRANWARVGKDAPAPYLFDTKFVQSPTLPDGGYRVDASSAVASNLVPEISDSWEVGLDTRFFNSKTRLDVAYYSTRVSNQIVTVRVSPASGYILQVRNEGDIENHGMEFSLEQDLLRTKNIQWTAAFNLGFNRGKVVGLPENVTEITGTQYGDIYTSAFLGSSTTAISGKDYARTDDGQVIVDANGYPTINTNKSLVIGNREPEFLSGISSQFSYKKLSVSCLFDLRKGGDIINVTGRGLWSSGQHKAIEFYRGRQVVWDGVVQQEDGTYVKNTTPIVLDQSTINNYYTAVSSNFIEDGSYLRLSYVTIGYDLTSVLPKKGSIKGLKCSLTGTNLFLLTRYTGSDPQINANTSAGGTGSMGVDNYAIPNTRGFNFTINANF